VPRSDLLLTLVDAGLRGDSTVFRRAVEAVIAEERAKQHNVLADRLANQLTTSNGNGQQRTLLALNPAAERPPVIELTPSRQMKNLVLPTAVRQAMVELVEEQQRAGLLRVHGLEPRHTVLLMGPPGNGKTSLAEALAYELNVSFLVVRYEGVIGSYLGETAARLEKVFEYVRQRHCVLFFDEFDTVGKERGDIHDTGEIKRVVSSLLLQIDRLPSHVLTVAATNHAELLDRAAWRRFQLRLLLPKPSLGDRERWLANWEALLQTSLGYSHRHIATKLGDISFAALEEFALAIHRRYVLQQPGASMKDIVRKELARWKATHAGGHNS
jgi:SpoVK/Ycf46/Vps4 family AAA+-type ATPase